jgi:hypothetical protein
VEVISACMLNVILPKLIVPLDVAPPPVTVAALGLGVLFTIGCGVVIIVAVSVLVIRALRKKNTPTDKD